VSFVLEHKVIRRREGEGEKEGGRERERECFNVVQFFFGKQ
jgi:hypothetical protein